MRDHRLLKHVLLGTFCLMMISGISRDSFGQVERAEALDAIQEQIIAFRKEFKLLMGRAVEDRQAVYENLQQKFEDFAGKQVSANEFQPDLAKKVNELLPLLEEYDQQIDSLEQVVDEMQTTMNDTLTTLEAQFAAAKKEGIQIGRSSLSAGPPPIEEPELESETETEAAPLDLAPGKLFRLAYRFYMDGEYDVAIGGFQKYLTDYPNTQLSGAAQYWIAEAFAKLEEYDIALQEYNRLLSTYPQDDKVADAHYGIGAALLKRGHADDAQAEFRYVVDHFAGTIAAKKAQRRLDEGR